MDVQISTNAFWALLVSAIEVYKKETFGTLLGYRDSNNTFIVEHAIPYQTATRTHGSVEKNRRAHERIQKFFANLPQLSVVGDFHSHTGWGELQGVGSLSTQDVVDMEQDQISLVIVANDKRKASAWKYNRDGSLSGTVDDYHFRLGVYYLDEKRKPKRANIFCPYAIGFNAKESQPKLFTRGHTSVVRGG